MIFLTHSPLRTFFFVKHSGYKFSNITCWCTGTDVSQIEANVSHFPLQTDVKRGANGVKETENAAAEEKWGKSGAL